jgi:hypothetical protein
MSDARLRRLGSESERGKAAPLLTTRFPSGEIEMFCVFWLALILWTSVDAQVLTHSLVLPFFFFLLTLVCRVQDAGWRVQGGGSRV